MITIQCEESFNLMIRQSYCYQTIILSKRLLNCRRKAVSPSKIMSIAPNPRALHEFLHYHVKPVVSCINRISFS